MTTKPGIYLITNVANGFKYLGSAVNLSARWTFHKYKLRLGTHHNPRLQAAWNKYGEESFSIEVIELVEDKAKLLQIEQKWIDEYDAANRHDFYNFCAVAGSHLGRKRSIETRKKLSLALTGKTASDETKAKQRLAKIGRKLTPEHIEKVRQSSTGRKYPDRTEEFKQKCRKLKPEAIKEMMEKRQQGTTLIVLAKEYHVSIRTVSRIFAGEHYVSITNIKKSK